jgi:peptide/nickel transport system ATP-binding protein
MEEILRLDSVSKLFHVPSFYFIGFGKKKFIQAVSNISFEISQRETLGLVGESGSGKSTTGKLALRLIEPTAGRIIYRGIDITRISQKSLRKWRRNAQMIFQDPNASLPPRMKIGDAIRRAARIHLSLETTEEKEKVMQTLHSVGLNPPAKYFDRYPVQLSGGERQRAVIARALICSPEFIVADEPVAMLDVSVRAQIIELMKQLKDLYGLTYLLITHDLSIAGYLCDRIAVMYLGKIVEIGKTEEILKHPRHPYTAALLASIPIPDPTKKRQTSIPKGEIPSPIDPPSGCNFHPRCGFALDSCKFQEPAVVNYSSTHWARCPVAPLNDNH